MTKPKTTETEDTATETEAPQAAAAPGLGLSCDGKVLCHGSWYTPEHARLLGLIPTSTRPVL